MVAQYSHRPHIPIALVPITGLLPRASPEMPTLAEQGLAHRQHSYLLSKLEIHAFCSLYTPGALV